MKPPRFVLIITDEDAPEMPPDLPVGIYDTQEKKPVLVFGPGYQQLICLETTERSPFTDMVEWMNSLEPATLASEDIPE